MDGSRDFKRGLFTVLRAGGANQRGCDTPRPRAPAPRDKPQREAPAPGCLPSESGENEDGREGAASSELPWGVQRHCQEAWPEAGREPCPSPTATAVSQCPSIGPAHPGASRQVGPEVLPQGAVSGAWSRAEKDGWGLGVTEQPSCPSLADPCPAFLLSDVPASWCPPP